MSISYLLNAFRIDLNDYVFKSFCFIESMEFTFDTLIFQKSLFELLFFISLQTCNLHLFLRDISWKPQTSYSFGVMKLFIYFMPKYKKMSKKLNGKLFCVVCGLMFLYNIWSIRKFYKKQHHETLRKASHIISTILKTFSVSVLNQC